MSRCFDVKTIMEGVMKKEEKTNVMRVLDGKKIPYESHSYEPDATMSGEEIAGVLGRSEVGMLTCESSL